MREEFITYMHETNAPRSAEDTIEGLEDALDPSKFIFKHFGNEGVQDPEFLFKEIISEVPDSVAPDSNQAVFSFLNNDCMSEPA